MTRVGLPAILLFAVIAALVLAPGGAAQTRTDMLLGSDDTAADPLVEALNRVRQQRGVEPLSVDLRLNGAAAQLAEDAGYSDWTEGSSIEQLATRERASQEMAVQGYEAATFGVALALSGEGDDHVLSALMGGEGEEAQSKLVSASYRDVGLGRSWVEGVPFYVVLVAKEQLGEADLAEATAELENVSALRKTVLKRVNKARKDAKRPLVKPSRCLDVVAQNYAEDMLERDWYGHVSPEGHDALIRVTGGHCVFRSAAENIARGVFTVDDAMNQWLGTEEDAEVLLDRRYAEAGFGLAYGQTTEGLQVFWVLVYGSQEGHY